MAITTNSSVLSIDGKELSGESQATSRKLETRKKESERRIGIRKIN